MEKVLRHLSYFMQDGAFILNIFSFLPKRMKKFRNITMISNLIKSAVFIYLEMSLYYNKDISPQEKKQYDNIINYAIYGVEGLLIQPMLIAGYIFVYKK